MSQEFNVAILGATGAVGETILEVLQEREFPVGELHLLASERSEGKTYRFNGKTIRVQNVENFDWSQVHIALFSAGGELSEKWAPVAADEGVVVIDNTSQFRYDYDVPLVVPEVNPEAIAEFRNRNIIANPNCSTIQMLVALKPIHDAAGIERINVSTYQSVSGAGKAGIDELAGQTAHLLNAKPIEEKAFSQQIAFNCIPQIDKFMDNGYTKEEMKMVWETQKIFNDSSIMVNPTCVRVPVFYGHAEAVHIETRTPIDADQVTQLLEQTEGVEVFHGEDFPTQVRDAGGKDHVLVGRIRNDISHHSGVNLWVVADNVRKGAATNAVQIAEVLIRDYF
ncbi:Aspartate-semialdehyde dehydrogenase [Vibrio nigripulchritudo MADA3029]|uniref:Aspartate-semialdehyde dehydrogenase n=1 Tax=Vibrio nigripulchritudo TaxID=28173 RepID=U4K9V8_9VIBR|nr:aspartate-semialdehyde dehydrogenase [Vibrio nigripulchritudo]EGU61110.1 aspartate-semialdehyde dehydrogenase [Vibrio nigripulchritudo ATCC 27043]KJY79866.1 aspartate-semialdehyde dehydrogenase [Vibrio nigripulchritudo]CCN36108.1 Aspartate-semialdehyde dehydrogenase [Vibrio nigripulchritudo AM115]CCN44388.1 Aspartate-semialdehyde dehydrogenase [Vibrio nigripulchritudo FTn2]CCN48666.1 Aspartate-semialdehyde dehydrogenase [Vibrio nigripulchritudo MADA3020]